MIIREDFDIKLRKALARHYGLNKVYVDKIRPDGFNIYRIKIKVNDKFEWIYYLNEPILISLSFSISLEDIVKVLIDKFEEDKRGVTNDN